MKFIPQCYEKEWYLENESKFNIFRGNIVDNNVMHTMTSKIVIYV